jgi:uncharacterized protein GlcG (DUF336 family)
MSAITLAQANQIIQSTLAKARELDLPAIGCAVLDPGGHLKAFQAEDGLSFVRIQVCQAKAWGALGMGVDSSKLAERYLLGDTNPGFFIALNAMSGGRVVPLAGGVLIRDQGGHVIGAVGVSGAKSHDDEACARAGIEAVFG